MSSNEKPQEAINPNLKQPEGEKMFYIDFVYKTLKIGEQTWPFVDIVTTEKRDKLKTVLKMFEAKMQEAIARNSDVIGMEAKEELAKNTLALCIPTLVWEKVANDEKIGVGLLEVIARDFRSIFLNFGGANGLKALSERQSQMQSMQAS